VILGLVEYFYWCEDMGMATVLAVWAGFSLGAGGDIPFTGDALQPYTDDVIAELEVSVDLHIKRAI
jgi:alpha-N-arabinofuranosidase